MKRSGIRPQCWYAASVLAALLLATSAGAETKHLSQSQIQQVFKAQKPVLEAHVLGPSAVDKVAAGAQATLQPGEYLVVRLDERPRRLPAGASSTQLRDFRLQLPLGFIKPGEAGEEVLLRAEIIVDGGGLAPTDEGFSGSLRLGLREEGDSSSEVTLDPPIKVFVSASPATVSPGDLQIDRTNDYKAVAVTTALAPPAVKVSIRPSFADTPIEVSIPVLSRIVLRASPQSPQGLGLASSRITVALEPAPSAPVTIRLSSDRGQPEPPSVTVSGETPEYVELRTAGLGTARVEAEAGMAVDGIVELAFVFPYGFLGATLLGGVFGGYLRAWNARKKKPKTKRAPYIMAGIIVGLFAAVLGTLGVNLAGVTFSANYGEGVYFLGAGLGAFGGSDRLKLWDRTPTAPGGGHG